MTTLFVLVLIFVVLFWAFVEVAAVVGFVGALMGEQIERCIRCHRYGLTTGGVMHPNGCPEHLRARLLHGWLSLEQHLGFHRIHLRHH